jgi:hypothetical protein
LGRLDEFVDKELRGVYRPAGWSSASVGTLITPQMALGFLRPSELVRAAGALSASYVAEARKYGQPPYEHEPNDVTPSDPLAAIPGMYALVMAA